MSRTWLIVLTLAVAVLPNARLGVQRLMKLDWSQLGASELGRADAALVSLREALPRGADVGYSSEDYESARNARFMQMRYALAPQLVMPGSDHEWVVARDRRDLEGFRVVIVAADGSALLRRQP